MKAFPVLTSLICLALFAHAEPSPLPKTAQEADIDFEYTIMPWVELAKKMIGGKSFITDFEKSQKAWIVYRDAQAILEAKSASSTPKEYEAAYIKSYVYMTEVRKEITYKFFYEALGGGECHEGDPNYHGPEEQKVRYLQKAEQGAAANP